MQTDTSSRRIKSLIEVPIEIFQPVKSKV